MAGVDARPLASWPYLGIAIASIGGPLALGSLAVSTAAGGAAPSVGLATLVGSLLFVAPLAIWYRYSAQVASAGGLYRFVELSAGRRAAAVHGWLWVASYFLYLPFTVTFIVYDLLPVVFPGSRPYRSALELALPLVFVAIAFAPLEPVALGVGCLAALQVLLLGAVAAVGVAHLGLQTGSFALHANAHAVAVSASAYALLFVCASLPLYLGGEVAGGSRTVRAGLVASFLVVGVSALAAAFPFATAPAAVRASPLPAYALVRLYAGDPLATAVGALTIASVACLIVLEFVALGRLLPQMLAVSRRRALAVVSLLFVAGDAVSLLDPERIYDRALTVSLAALFASQLVVFAVYPRFRRQGNALGAGDVGLAAVACTLFAYGLWQVLDGGLAG